MVNLAGSNTKQRCRLLADRRTTSTEVAGEAPRVGSDANVRGNPDVEIDGGHRSVSRPAGTEPGLPIRPAFRLTLTVNMRFNGQG